MSTLDRRGLIDRDRCQLSIRRQCELLGLARSGVYRPAAAESGAAVGVAA